MKLGKRYIGIGRGPLWFPEPPEAYGVAKSNLELPLWADGALGYYFDGQFFAVYHEGDWFDGMADGEGWSGYALPRLLHTKLSTLDEEAVLLCKENGVWQCYKGRTEAVGAWMELHVHKTEHGASELVKDIFPFPKPSLDGIEQELSKLSAQKNRLILWLNNVRTNLT